MAARPNVLYKNKAGFIMIGFKIVFRQIKDGEYFFWLH